MTLSYILKATKFLVKISQCEFFVTTEQNIVSKLFLSLNLIKSYSLFKNCDPPPPLKKVTQKLEISELYICYWITITHLSCVVYCDLSSLSTSVFLQAFVEISFLMMYLISLIFWNIIDFDCKNCRKNKDYETTRLDNIFL